MTQAGIHATSHRCSQFGTNHGCLAWSRFFLKGGPVSENRFGDKPSCCFPAMSAQADRVMAISEWEGRWQVGRVGFHQPHVHRMLERNLDRVLCSRKEVRFFFPLCGKAVDMKWLADMGHTVVAVEISEKAIKQFFEEHNLSYAEDLVPTLPEGKIFKSSDGKITIYQCNIYHFSRSVAGQFGAIWDRGSLVAINPCDRQRYATLLTSLMDRDCRYLLDTLEYNPDLYKGPPFYVQDEDLRNLFGDSCDIQLLESEDALGERQREWGLDYMIEKVHVLTLKTS